MKNTLKLLVVGACALGTAVAANAATIVGSDAIALFNVTTNPSETSLYPISGVTSFGFSNGITTSVGTGNFSVIPGGTTVMGSTSFTPAGPNGGTSTTPFSLTFAGFGTFTETANPVVVSNSQPSTTASAVDFYLLGVFTPLSTGALSSYSAGPASLDIAFTESGTTGVGGNAVVSSSGTLTSPPAGVSVTPEPSSLVLLGTGLAGFAGVLRRRTLGK